MAYKTRKTNKRRNLHKKNSYRRMYGGEDVKQTINSPSNDKQAEEIMDKIEAQNQITLPGINEIPVVGPIIEKTGDLIEGSSIKAIDSVGNLIGIDIDNPNSISDKLSDIKNSLSNPENVEKLKEIAKEAGKFGEVAVVAFAPAAERFVDTTLPIVAEGFDKAIKSGAATGINLLEDVAGPFIGIPRTFLSAAEAFNASVNAGSELVRGTAEGLQGTYENYSRLMNKMNNVSMPKMEVPKVEMPKMETNLAPNSIGSLKNAQKEANMIGGRVNKSQLEFLDPYINQSQIIKQNGGKHKTKKRKLLKRKHTAKRK